MLQQKELSPRPAASKKASETKSPAQTRRLPIGAEVQPGGVHFRVWAPKPKSVAVHLAKPGESLEKSNWLLPMEQEADGYFSILVPAASPGMLYKFHLESGEFPDPASRFQPIGPHGPSEIIDPNEFRWTDS